MRLPHIELGIITTGGHLVERLGELVAAQWESRIAAAKSRSAQPAA